jgi:PAS domain S-box-containing protein
VTEPREPLRVLVVEHDPSDSELCLHALEHAGFEVQGDVVDSPEQFAERVRTGVYDVVLADYNLPGWTGLDALELLRALGLDVPLILVTGTLGEERAVECLRGGVADYILKQNMASLPVAVRRALEERRASRERAGSEDLIRKVTLAVDQGPVSVVVTDTTGLIRYVNQRFEEVTGHSAEEVLGRTPRILKSGRTPDDVYRELWETIRSGQVWHGELLNRRKDGAVYWAALRIAPVRDTAGNITDFLAIQEDITERKQTEEALKESEARFRKIIDASFDGIASTQEGVVLEANQGFAEMFGYTLEEVIGLPVADFIAEESRESALQRIGQHIEGSYELVGKRKDGRKILLEATARTHEIGGRPARVTALRDVTERRTLEEQSRQAQKMEAVGRLAVGVAHDFNNLLTVITSYAEILLGDLAANDARRQDVEQIQKAATDAATLTGQLLALSRQQVIAPRLVALEELVGGSAKIL